MSDWGDDELDPADVDDAAVDQATGEVVDEEPAAEPSLYYGSVDEFLRDRVVDRHLLERVADQPVHTRIADVQHQPPAVLVLGDDDDPCER